MIEHKDVVLAVLGASAGLAGLVLVFLGLVANAYKSFRSDTSDNVLRPYRRAAGLVLGAFGLGVLCVALATAWMVNLEDNQCLYSLTLAAFGAQLVALAASTCLVTYRIFWAD